MKRVTSLTLLLVLCFSTLLQAQFPNQLKLPKDREFDFWIGEWNVNLRIQQPDKQWKDGIKSKAKIYAVNDGRAILELWNDQRPDGIKGFSLRYYDFEKKKWVLWLNWPSKNRSGLSSLQGEFRHGRGEFFGGKGDTLTRYSFSDISPYYLRWDDAFTRDGGKTWTHNWIMEFTRTAEAPDWPEGTRGHTFDKAGRCDTPGFDVFRSLTGTWSGEVKQKEGEGWKNGQADLKGFEVLNGCAVLNFMTTTIEGKAEKEFSIKSFNTYANKLEDGRLASDKTSILQRYYSVLPESKVFSMTEFDEQGEQQIIRKYDWDMSTTNKVLITISEAPKREIPVWEKVRELTLTRK
ncbi:MAG: hypothetical protein HEP71_29485 [Roseivirga sp.]|nr:hypothetical protein [Roseivirga sp.]